MTLREELAKAIEGLDERTPASELEKAIFYLEEACYRMKLRLRPLDGPRYGSATNLLLYAFIVIDRIYLLDDLSFYKEFKMRGGRIIKAIELVGNAYEMSKNLVPHRYERGFSFIESPITTSHDTQIATKARLYAKMMNRFNRLDADPTPEIMRLKNLG